LTKIETLEGEVAKAQQQVEEARKEKLAAIQVSIAFPEMLSSSRLHYTEMHYFARTNYEFTARKELFDSR